MGKPHLDVLGRSIALGKFVVALAVRLTASAPAKTYPPVVYTVVAGAHGLLGDRSAWAQLEEVIAEHGVVVTTPRFHCDSPTLTSGCLHVNNHSISFRVSTSGPPYRLLVNALAGTRGRRLAYSCITFKACCPV